MSKKWYQKSGAEGDVIISTRVRLARNLQGYPFPCRLDAAGREQIAGKVRDAMFHSNSVIADSFQY